MFDKLRLSLLFILLLSPVPVILGQGRGSKAFSAVAVGLTVNTLGAGVQMATPLAQRLNLRVGVNVFAFGHPLDIDGVHYAGDLHYKSGMVSVDWFPWRGSFHISPGFGYFRNSLSAVVSVPPGAGFELGDQPLINSVDDPIRGTAGIIFPRNYAPTLMVGFGNLIPRSPKRLSIPVEIGVAFTGTPNVSVSLAGEACANDGCFDAETNAELQQNLKEEVRRLNNDFTRVPIYPIVSVGVGYRF